MTTEHCRFRGNRPTTDVPSLALSATECRTGFRGNRPALGELLPHRSVYGRMMEIAVNDFLSIPKDASGKPVMRRKLDWYWAVCASVMFAALSVLAYADDKQKGNKKADDSAAGKSDSAGKSDKADSNEPKFVQTVKNKSGKPITLQTAIVTYKADSGPYVGKRSI